MNIFLYLSRIFINQHLLIFILIFIRENTNKKHNSESHDYYFSKYIKKKLSADVEEKKFMLKIITESESRKWIIAQVNANSNVYTIVLYDDDKKVIIILTCLINIIF